MKAKSLKLREATSLRSALSAFCTERTQGAKASTDTSRVLRAQQRKNNIYRKQELRYQIPQRSGG